MTTESVLLDRVRAASGPDRQIDLALGIMLCNWGDTPAGEEPPKDRPQYEQPDGHFTGSADAALALVERLLPKSRIILISGAGYWSATIQWDQRLAPDTDATGMTPALALLAALLANLKAQALRKALSDPSVNPH